MNQVLDARYSEGIQRLALGVEPIDAAREQPLLMPVMLTHDDAPFGSARQPFQRHASNRQALRYDAYYGAAPRVVVLRLFDQAEALYSPDNDRRRRPRSSSPAGPGTSCASTAASTPSPRTSCGTRTTRCAPSCSGSGRRCGWGAFTGWCRTTAVVGAVEYLLRPVRLRC